MAKTTLKPYLKERLLVEIESTEPLTKEEEEEVRKGIRIAFSWIFEWEGPPTLSEIKQAIKDFNPALANKITGKKYC